MKKINNLIKSVLLCGVVLLSSCETTDLELTENPNALSPSQANADFFLNSVQVDFANLVESFGRTGSQVTRIDYMSGRDYFNAFGPTSFDGRWSTAYQGMMQDIAVMNTLAEEKGLNYHIAMGQVMKAYTLMTLVDFFGPIPLTEALQGDGGNLNPVADSGADVYAAAIALLDAAIVNFGNGTTDPQYDFFYDGDWDQWIKAANTIKMKAYMTTRLTDGTAIAKFNAIVTGGNYISSTDDDFQFRWGTSELQPDTRHPRYAASYTATGGGRYKSNSLMAYMFGDDYFGPDYDIRLHYYNYRQVNATPGFGTPADEEVLECGLQTAPAHYAGFVFCANPRGYWGRDHGNDNGIPPDGFLRALTGVYPAGGRLDDFTYSASKNGEGNGGNGVTPIMLASWTDFMRAEERMVANDPSGAKIAMFEGIAKSFDKVTNFAPSTDRFDAIVDGNFGDEDVNGDPVPGSGLVNLIDGFTSNLDAKWEASTDKMEILSMQYFVALYGNGIDAYNFYRRTGYPTGLQPNIEPNPGSFIRSFLYPANYTNTNANATQKDNVTTQIFWDNNPASPGFPSAN